MIKPAISVLTPTYNRAHVLHRAYDSLNRQKTRDFEWVVVDDGSTDDTPALLARWQAEADFPITWLRYSKNRGRNAAVNTGAPLVSGDYTLILDSDDALLDHALEMIAFWRQRTGIDAIPSVYQLMFRCVDESDALVGRLKKDGESKLPQEIIRVSRRDAYYRLGMAFEFVGVTKTHISKDGNS